jgi:hypothetical protein
VIKPIEPGIELFVNAFSKSALAPEGPARLPWPRKAATKQVANLANSGVMLSEAIHLIYLW